MSPETCRGCVKRDRIYRAAGLGDSRVFLPEVDCVAVGTDEPSIWRARRRPGREADERIVQEYRRLLHDRSGDQSA
ncbi:hypothetical protein ACFY1A_24830 [Streptomyces sp. NPDC001520]|uniref:hypothetical protein n=1 Tax=Streptomyces sp. NPDC001520 TaxID=3364581 RepID=UPI0036B5D5BE